MSTYCTLSLVRQYGAITDPTLTQDDNLITDAITHASTDIDGWCGRSFAQANIVNENPRALTDRNGTLHLWAQQLCPVTAVTALSWYDIRYRKWTTVDLTQVDLFLPNGNVPPKPGDIYVQVYGPTAQLPDAGLDYTKLKVKWSYTGGYATTPGALQQIATRLAWWHYSLRKAPLGKVVLPMGGLDIPSSVPADVRESLKLWQLWV